PDFQPAIGDGDIVGRGKENGAGGRQGSFLNGLDGVWLTPDVTIVFYRKRTVARQSFCATSGRALGGRWRREAMSTRRPTTAASGCCRMQAASPPSRSLARGSKSVVPRYAPFWEGWLRPG